MKPFLKFLFSSCLILACTNVLADPPPPAVSYNVIVRQNVTANQCPSSWRGNAGQEDIEVYSRIGQSNAIGAGVRTCTQCSMQAQNCVCKTCYDYFN